MEDVVVACSSLGFFGMLFGLIAIMRYLAYRENLTLAEKGLVRPDRFRGGSKDTVRWGIIITALGLALCLGLWPLGVVDRTNWPLGIGPWMVVGILPTFFGLGLILVYLVTREKEAADEPPPAPRIDEPPR